MFASVFCSLGVCALIAVSMGVYVNTAVPEIPAVIEYIEHIEETGNFLLAETKEIYDPILEYFVRSDYRKWVVDFFSNICANQEVVLAILENSLNFNVSPALAFAVSWEESRFNPNAVNRANRDGSIDRGIFQLNNRSFPHLEISSFFNIRTNAYYGVGHLRYCLDTGGSEVSALAMYNAGTGRVRGTGTPEVTLNYISRILNNKSKIESQFHARLIREEEVRLFESRLDNETRSFHPYLNRTAILTSLLYPSL
jgi:hypothetical protein